MLKILSDIKPIVTKGISFFRNKNVKSALLLPYKFDIKTQTPESK